VTDIDSWRTPMLRGQHATLLPLQAAHAEPLGEAAADGALWTLVYTSVPAPAEASTYVERALQARDRAESMPFVVLDAQGEVVGTTRYYAIDRSVPTLNIGYTWYAARVQRTALNTEAKLMLLRHAFDALGCESVAFETSHLNARSQAAIERIGAKRDGVLRANLLHRDGSLRDTMRYSIVRAEWPAVEARLRERLEATA
jgi:RimJ/RimL family protein N-acetyltransferase